MKALYLPYKYKINRIFILEEIMDLSKFKDGINVEIKQESQKFTTVIIQGILDIEDIKKSAGIYIDLFNKGIKRLLIDLSGASTDFKLLLSSHEDLNKGLSKFEKIVVLVSNSENAFKVKAAASKNSKIQVYYNKSDAIKWLEEL